MVEYDQYINYTHQTHRLKHIFFSILTGAFTVLRGQSRVVAEEACVLKLITLR